MAVISSGTLLNTPRRRRFSEMSRKNRSTIFSHDAEVGVKYNQLVANMVILHNVHNMTQILKGLQAKG